MFFYYYHYRHYVVIIIVVVIVVVVVAIRLGVSEKLTCVAVSSLYASYTYIHKYYIAGQ